MRREDWLARLEAYIAERMAEPWAWGRHDCCRFSAGAVEAMTGEDLMRGFEYQDEAGARALIRSAGSLDALACRALGEPISRAFAGRGDIVIADLEPGPTLGVCLGGISAFAAEVGLTHRPTLSCRAAWRVG